jgi:hypothetical protein
MRASVMAKVYGKAEKNELKQKLSPQDARSWTSLRRIMKAGHC